jgi:curli biogenesis system outer membrane secretion channel CsgG
MKLSTLTRCAAALALAGAATVAFAQPQPKIAVTDLTYEEKVSEHFRVVAAHSKGNVKASGSERETRTTYSARDRIEGSHESSYFEASGIYSYIERGELRTYTADLKGAMLKGGGLRLTQAKPYAGKPTEQIYDIVARIKKGYYPGADYVLFGTVSNVEFREEAMPLPGAAGHTASLSLDLVADFSLINTRTYEVKAAFSAMGSGKDVKILTRPGDRVVFNRSKVIQETSRTMAQEAYAELMAQFGGPRSGTIRSSTTTIEMRSMPAGNAPVTVY